MAGVPGLEPGNNGIKTRCLTNVAIPQHSVAGPLKRVCLNALSLETSAVSLPESGGEEKYYSFERRNLSSVVATVAAIAAPVAIRSGGKNSKRLCRSYEHCPYVA